MTEIDYKTETKFKTISKLILEGNTSGYYPYWELSFGEFYRSWHLSNFNKNLIADSVLLENNEGFIAEIVENKKVKLYWSLKSEEE